MTSKLFSLVGLWVCPWWTPRGDGLWEVRSRLPTRIARTIFMVRSGTIILLNGFIKKTGTTPKTELDIARRRKHEIEKQSTHRK